MTPAPDAPPLPQIPAGRLRWRFASAELDEGTRQLSVDGRLREVEPKPLEFLMFLLRRQGELASKDHLLEALWPGRVVTEASLAKCVGKLRQALGDESQSIIVTVHGYGYRLGIPAVAETIGEPRLAPRQGAMERPASIDRRLVAIMFTDIVGYTALVQHDESAARQLLEFQRALVRRTLPEFGGREIEVIGDAFLIEFTSALRAAECAVAIQQSLAEQAGDRPVTLRIGLHLGDIERLDKGVFGDSVNVASRIQSVAPEGGLAVSVQVHDQIGNRLGTPLRSLGPTALKGIERPVEIFVVHRQTLLKLPKVHGSSPSRPVPLWRRPAVKAAATLLFTAVAIGAWMLGSAPPPRPRSDPSIAVLPFSNFSADPQNQYFVDGVHESILTQLAQVRGLKVISRTSVMRYREGHHDLRDIARKLGVAYVLEGSVQREGSQVRVTAQLIEAAVDNHLWAETYDRDLANSLSIQSEVAQKIVASIHSAMTPQDRARLSRPPTRNLEAYDLYLRAMAIRHDELPTAEPLQRIQTLLEKAVALDPDFALAHAWLSDNHGSMWWFGVDLTPQRLELAKSAAGTAERLDPQLAEVHFAWAGYYYAMRDYPRTIAETQIAVRLQPNFAGALELEAAAQRRQGQWDKALQTYQRALALDPHNPQIVRQLAQTYADTRRYEEGDRVFERYLAASPDAFLVSYLRADLRRRWTGDVEFLKKTLAAMPASFDPGKIVTLDRAWLARAEGRPDDAIAALRACGDWLPSWGSGYRTPTALQVGLVQYERGDIAAARKEFRVAREMQEAEVHERPDDARAHEYLALALAGLGERSALEVMERAISLMPAARDAVIGPEIEESRAKVYLLLGDADSALSSLEALAHQPNTLSPQVWKREPLWRSIAATPRFTKLVDQKS